MPAASTTTPLCIWRLGAPRTPLSSLCCSKRGLSSLPKTREIHSPTCGSREREFCRYQDASQSRCGPTCAGQVQKYPLACGARERESRRGCYADQGRSQPEGAGQVQQNPSACGGRERESRRVAVLIKAGANLKARDKFNRTPLHAAARNENPAVAAALLKAGAALHARDKRGNTPFIKRLISTRTLPSPRSFSGPVPACRRGTRVEIPPCTRRLRSPRTLLLSLRCSRPALT